MKTEVEGAAPDGGVKIADIGLKLPIGPEVCVQVPPESPSTNKLPTFIADAVCGHTTKTTSVPANG